MGKSTSFNYNDGMANFYGDIQKTLVQQNDYRGTGGHELQDHHSFGPHTEVTIGMVDRTINFRNLK
ncbi:MAG: hypothetical protein NTZ17_15500 [Phycisphaerae bacterium]|nr:hypothetical protein [Phycisphaerae bacterium]